MCFDKPDVPLEARGPLPACRVTPALNIPDQQANRADGPYHACAASYLAPTVPRGLIPTP